MSEPMTTGKGLTAAEAKAYQRGIAAGKREREDTLTEIIRQLERELELTRAELLGAQKINAELRERCAELEKILRQVQGGTWSMTSIDAALKEPQ